ncbi:MAG: hypothetical protein ACTSRZ_10120 [Promethearchaeota archaeon]
MVKISFDLNQKCDENHILELLQFIEINNIKYKRTTFYYGNLPKELDIYEAEKKVSNEGRYHYYFYFKNKRTGLKKTFKHKRLVMLIHFDQNSIYSHKASYDYRILSKEVRNIEEILKESKIGSLSYKDRYAYHLTLKTSNRKYKKNIDKKIKALGFKYNPQKYKYERQTRRRYQTISLIFSDRFAHITITSGVSVRNEKAKYLKKEEAKRIGKALLKGLKKKNYWEYKVHQRNY